MRMAHLLLAAAFVVSAQQQNEPPKKARIEGSVVSLAGEPVPRATLRIVDAAAPASFTPAGSPGIVADDAGKFVFENVEPGRAYRVVAQRPGYLRAPYGARSPMAPGIPVIAEVGLTVEGLVITMTPQSVISGRVTDLTGDSVQGVQVIILRRGYRSGVRQLIAWTGTATDDQGAFRVADVPPGSYYALARELPNQVRAGRIATYYPSAPNPEAAVPIDVAPGTELRGIDIRFLTAQTYAVRGRVDVSAAPGERISVTAVPKGLTFGDISASVRADNSFEIPNLAPGTYVIQTLARAVRNGEPSMRQNGGTEVTITSADLNGLVVPINTSLSITGTITVEGEDAAARSGARPVLRGRPGKATPASSAGSQVEVKGTFRISGLAPGNYQLQMADLPTSAYVKSARFGDQDALHSSINVTRSGGELVIVLSNKAAQVSGALRDDKAAPLTGFLVTLWPMDPEPANATDGVRTTYTDRNGAFQFRGLPPGEYSVTAWEDADPELVLSRDFLAGFASEADKVTLTEGSQGVIDPKLVSMEKITAAEAKLP